MKRTKFIPALVMLTAGLIYCIIALKCGVEMFLFTKELLLVLIIFCVIGTIIRVVLDINLKILEEDAPGEEDTKEPGEEGTEGEMENIDIENDIDAKEEI